MAADVGGGGEYAGKVSAKEEKAPLTHPRRAPRTRPRPGGTVACAAPPAEAVHARSRISAGAAPAPAPWLVVTIASHLLSSPKSGVVGLDVLPCLICFVAAKRCHHFLTGLTTWKRKGRKRDSDNMPPTMAREWIRGADLEEWGEFLQAHGRRRFQTHQPRDSAHVYKHSGSKS